MHLHHPTTFSFLSFHHHHHLLPMNHDADDDFQQKSAGFVDWLRHIPNASISDKIALTDLRARGAGRGVGVYYLDGAPLVQTT